MANLTTVQNERRVFVYEVQTRDKQFQKGKITAPSKERVAEFLLEKGYYPLDIREQSRLRSGLTLGERRVKPKEVSAFVRQLSTLVGSGLPLSRSLAAIRRQTTINPSLRTALTRISDDIGNGTSLSEAMAKYPKIFPPVVIAMISAGEAGGFLARTLDEVATNLEAQVRLVAKIKSAMTYPIIVFVLAVIITAAMLIFIVPVFAGLYSQLGGNLPLPTQILVYLSNILKFGFPIIIAGIVALVILWRNNRHKQGYKAVVDPLLLRMPVFGKLVQLIVTARFARNYSSLADAGLPIVQVMSIVGATSGSYVIEQAVGKLTPQVAAGQPIAGQLAQYPVFPMTMIEMMTAGEEAGEIPLMLRKAAEAQDVEIESMTENLSSLIEPLMLILLGVMVGGVVISLYLPIFSLYSLISSQ